MSSSELEIIVMRDHHLVESLVITGEQATIGRASGSQVRLDDPAIEAKHAVVHFTGRTCLVEDLGSSAGTWLNRERIQSQIIQPRDEIVIAPFTLRFVIHRSAEAPAAREEDRTQITKRPTHLDLSPDLLSPGPGSGPVATSVAALVRGPGESTPVASTPVAVSLVTAKPVSIPERVAPASKKRDHEEAKTQRLTTRSVTPETSAPAGALKPALHVESMPEPHRPFDDDDEDDQEEESFVPSFSLVSNLASSGASGPADGLVVQAVAYRDESVARVQHLVPGGRLSLRGRRPVVCRYNKGRLIVHADDIPAHAFREGREIDAASLQHQDKGRKVFALVPGQALTLEVGAKERMHLGFVKRVELARMRAKPKRPDKPLLASGGLSLFVHLIIFAAIAVASWQHDQATDLNEGRFAKIALTDLELEPPKPPTEPVKAPEPPMPRAAEPAPRQKPTPAPKQAARAAPSQPAPAKPVPKTSQAASNLLSALGAPMPGSSATPSAAMAATTNLDAVKAPRPGGFKVSGVIGKLPGDSLRMAAAGSGIGRIDTRSAAEVTSGGKIGKIGVASGGGGKVRAVVNSAPARSVEVQGQLDRGAIQAVVNSHLHEVQGCYERQLIRDPSLSGKVVLEWIVTPTGSVGVVRVKNSTLRGTEVSTCMQAAVQRWKFPSPKGGSVTVVYPFIFNTIGL